MHADHQARIADLERELGLEPEPAPGQKVTEIAQRMEQLARQVEALSGRREVLRAAPPEMDDERQRALLDVNRQIRQALQDFCEARDELNQAWEELLTFSARASRQRQRVVGIRVIAEGRNRWLVQIQTVVGEDGAEGMMQLRLAGWRQRKIAKRLAEMGESHSSSAV